MTIPITFKKFNKEIIPINPNYLYDGEIFIDVTSNVVPLVYDYYQISNYGRVYHKYLGKFMSPGINGAGYHFIIMQTYEEPKPVQIHRLVMMSFFYIEGCEYLDVNHKDGNKTRNVWWNLEWMTRQENIIHAYKNGLMKPHTNLDNDTVIQVCNLLEENRYTSKEIADIVGNGVTVSIVNSIKRKESWNNISSNYSFYHRPGKLFTKEMIESICLYFQNNSIGNLCVNDHCKNALNYCGYDSSERYIDSARKIYNRKYYANISNKYTF